jgi:hypothetical protein
MQTFPCGVYVQYTCMLYQRNKAGHPQSFPWSQTANPQVLMADLQSANYVSCFCKSINSVGCFLLSVVQIRKCCWLFCKFANFFVIFANPQILLASLQIRQFHWPFCRFENFVGHLQIR